MSTISDRINVLAMTLNPRAQRALSSRFTDFAENLESLVMIDWQTGQSQFDESALRDAVDELQQTTQFVLGGSFADYLVADLSSGFAILDRDRQDVVPWRRLTDPLTVSQLSEARLQALGVTAAPPQSIAQEISMRYQEAPSLTIDATSQLARALRDERLVSSALENTARISALLSGAAADVVTPSGVEDILRQVEEFVGGCLRRFEPTTVSFSVGPGVCMDETCARLLDAILTAGGAAELGRAGAAAIAAGSINAAITAAVAAVGGWVVFIVTICVVVFSRWFNSVITSNGACIHFPWWAGFGPVPFGR